MLPSSRGPIFIFSGVSVSAERHSKLDWMDVIWLLFLLGLALLPPVREVHKQIILLAMLLISHTGEVGINSSYYPIFYLPVVTAAVYCDAWQTLAWTSIASAAYCSYLLAALQEYELAPCAEAELALRILFFFLAAM